MPQNESVQFFLRFVQERHELVKNRINETLQALSSDNHDVKVKASQALLEACEDLSNGLSNEDRPMWLSLLIRDTEWYLGKHKVEGNNFKILNKILDHRNKALSHAWSFDKHPSDFDFNFDELYERFRKDSKLPNLFDALIETLQKMISSGDIDSITAIKGLEQLMELIKQNKSGSYFSIMSSWEFIASFTKNLIWQELGNIPGIKQMKSAFEKTAHEMDIELDELHKSIAKEMKEKYKTTVHSLTYKRVNNILKHKSEDE